MLFDDDDDDDDDDDNHHDQLEEEGVEKEGGIIRLISTIKKIDMPWMSKTKFRTQHFRK